MIKMPQNCAVFTVPHKQSKVEVWEVLEQSQSGHKQSKVELGQALKQSLSLMTGDDLLLKKRFAATPVAVLMYLRVCAQRDHVIN